MQFSIDTRDSAVCHVCGERAVSRVTGYENLPRVTSDCRPWKRGGSLGVCGRCGCVQKIVDDAYIEECRAIYSSYDVYRLSGGREQKTFDQRDGRSETRSEHLIGEILKAVELPESGRILDIGCGNGNLLRSFSRQRGSWTLEGLDLDDRNRNELLAIPGCTAFHTGDIGSVPGTFNFITLLHSFEHIVDPLSNLSSISGKLAPDGLLLIQAPEFTLNPFDLAIADHATHSTVDALAGMLGRTGFEVVVSETTIIPKELTVVARKRSGAFASPDVDARFMRKAVIRALSWLSRTVDDAKKQAEAGEFGLFGTSIASIFLYGELGNSVCFFVDEDTGKTSRNFMGRPVLNPGEIKKDQRVYLAFPPTISERIAGRMKDRPGEYLTLPDYPSL